ncbi:RimJ/RimL family protein N-acetyltransferase [Anaerobacterium chartisolvens]|uniref:RimJ/RimL family protein N-acetyltransferase n=1 Tax=Anaerobacterium chartisolvens TaxID=1297424 RepID=A0A369BA20_9FIRM|nr:GNAT family protein [Anaerobacterium chartisolvens]RCX18370.1 RimJ/RimL family protein N-acetyltransferase [Anaerobacterium chartisolvens]
MKLEDDNIILREWEETDVERLAEIANNKKIYDNLRDAFPHPYSIDDARQYITLQLNGDNKLSKVFAILVDGKVAGSIGAFLKEDVYRKNAEIGYYLAEEYWGIGIMTKAIKILIEYVFETFDITRIYAEPFARNVASRRSLEKVGFRLEAELKCNAVKNGIIEDSCIYAILKCEFIKCGSIMNEKKG